MSGETHESRRRNTKIQPLQRGYGCPCGKTYLSYPALFTHIKQKHSGKAPGQITKPKNQQTKRGRPRTSSISLTETQELIEMRENPLEYIQQVIGSEKNQPSTTLYLQNIDSGRSNIVQVLGLFLSESKPYVSESVQSIVSGFLQIIKITVDGANGQNYCQNNKASELVQYANEIVDQCCNGQKNSFTLSREGTIQVTKIFFEWLYKNDLTDHIIQEKSSQIEF